MRIAPFALVAGLAAAPAAAGTVTVTLPRLPIAEYKKPYVAGWIEPAAGGAARTLFVWYDRKTGREPGTKWLADLRSWWRKSGRTLALPADGVSGATRPPGSYTVALPADLPAGQYVLNVEAARENGGHDLVSVPVRIPGGTARGTGHAEIGTVSVAAR